MNGVALDGVCARLLLVATLGVGAGCSGEDDSPQGTSDRGSLAFRACGSHLECAELDVPVDYAEPNGATTRLALVRLRGDDQVAHQGTVVVNNGGPGASGKRFVIDSATGLRALFPGFDFVGFDPRGVGESSPFNCQMTDMTYADYLEVGVAGYLEIRKQDSARCAQDTGPLFAHVSSNHVVDDIEQIRIALGEPSLNFLGISYGTRLGALYAQKYPDTTRAIVLDASVAPTVNPQRDAARVFDAHIDAQAEFFEACQTGKLACPPEAERVLDELQKALAELNRLDFLLVNWPFGLTSASGREYLANLLSAFAKSPDIVRQMSPSSGSSPGAILSAINLGASLTITCADSAVEPPSLAEGEAMAKDFRARAPLFELQGLSGVNCSAWSVPRDPAPAFSLSRPLPLLIIGGEHDVLTPLDWAEETSRALPGSRLLRSAHYGHSALLSMKTLCVRDVISSYFRELQLPKENSVCPAE